MAAFKVTTPGARPATIAMYAMWVDACDLYGVGQSYGTRDAEGTWFGAWGNDKQVGALLATLNRAMPGWSSEKNPPGAAGW